MIKAWDNPLLCHHIKKHNTCLIYLFSTPAPLEYTKENKIKNNYCYIEYSHLIIEDSHMNTHRNNNLLARD